MEVLDEICSHFPETDENEEDDERIKNASKNIIKMDFKYIDGNYLYLNTVGEEIENISKECSFSGIAGVWRNLNSEDIYITEFNKTKYGPIERH